MRMPTAIGVLRTRREGPAGIDRCRDLMLHDLIGFARRHSPLLRERYAHVPSGSVSLDELPVMTKPDLMANFDAWVTDRQVTRASVQDFVDEPGRVGLPYRGSYFVCQSSGTTGHPGLFVHDRRSVRAYEALSLRLDLAWLTARQWWGLMLRRSRWMAVVGTGGHYAGEGWMQWQRTRDPVRRRTFGVLSLQRPLAETVTHLNALNPAVLTSYPSELDVLGQEQSAGRLRLDPVLLEAGGESITVEMRRRIETAFGVPLRETYSSSEFLTMAYSCAQQWMHVNADWLILEPVDALGQPTPPGQPSHTVLLTHLANLVQPLIRYDLGDSIIVRDGPCTCGDRLPAIRVHGRRGDALRMPGTHDRWVTIAPLALATVAEQVMGVRRFQLIQAAPNRLRVRLETQPGSQVTEVWPRMRQAVTGYLTDQDVLNALVEYDPASPHTNETSGKFQQVIPLVAA